jgi:hypothetical protein
MTGHGGVDHLVLDGLDLGVDHVLVVVDRGQVHELARVHEADGGQRLHLTVLEGDDHVLPQAKARPSPLVPFFSLVR